MSTALIVCTGRRTGTYEFGANKKSAISCKLKAFTALVPSDSDSHGSQINSVATTGEPVLGHVTTYLECR